MDAQIDSDQLDNIPKYIFYPYSSWRSSWDIVMILFVIYNVVTLPIELGIGIQHGTFQTGLESFIDIFFFCDIILNFFTGYIDENNKLIMNQKQIIKHYLSLWFWVDLLATLPFETILTLSGKDAGEHIKLFALLKTPRLLRIGRILKFIENMKGANIWRIIRLFLMFFLLSHWIGLFWYFIADYNEDMKIQGLHKETFYDKYQFSLYTGLLILVGESVETKFADELSADG
jgi:hypothetical protein